MKDIIESMKDEFTIQLSEWLGSDIPEEGTEDYDTWKSRALDIDDIKNFSDVYDYLGGGEPAQEFFESHGVSDFLPKS